jgi:hypothetical protein
MVKQANAISGGPTLAQHKRQMQVAELQCQLSDMLLKSMETVTTPFLLAAATMWCRTKKRL